MDDIFYVGNKAYGDVNTKSTLIQSMMSRCEYPVYSGRIIASKTKDESAKAKFADKYVKRVPEMDKDIIVIK